MSWDSYTHRDLARDYEGDRVDCECEDCGKKFKRGDEGDNERFCLRCCESSRLERMRARDPEAYDHWLVFGDDNDDT